MLRAKNLTIDGPTFSDARRFSRAAPTPGGFAPPPKGSRPARFIYE
jgi:hypothetical protein